MKQCGVTSSTDGTRQAEFITVPTQQAAQLELSCQLLGFKYFGKGPECRCSN